MHALPQVKHWMNGHEIAIDRATPKEEPSALKSMFSRLPLQSGQRRSFDNGECAQWGRDVDVFLHQRASACAIAL